MASPGLEAIQNKAKIEADMIIISGNKLNHGSVSSHCQYQNVFGASKTLNVPLDANVDANIRHGHFKTGYGRF